MVPSIVLTGGIDGLWTLVTSIGLLAVSAGALVAALDGSGPRAGERMATAADDTRGSIAQPIPRAA